MAEAIDQVYEHEDGTQIRLLLLDMMMPKMGGRATWQAIQAIRPGVKCALVSDYGPESTQLDSDSEEHLAILPKPAVQG